MIFRCVNPGETTHLQCQDLALIIDKITVDTPAGYGIYLAKESCQNTGSALRKVYNLPEGCVSGSFVLLDENDAIHLLETGDIPDRTLFTTGLCNSNCIMCPYSEKYRLSSKIDPIEMLSRFVDLMDPYSDYVCITGGEPTLLKWDSIRLVKKVTEHFQSVMLHILTNGRTFAYKDFLEEFLRVRPYRTLLGIPLHADNASLHDSITQSSGSFIETIRGLDNLYSKGERIELRIVTSKLNSNNLPALSKMIAQRYPYCQHVCFMGLEMMGNAMINRNQVWCNYDLIWPYIRESVEHLISNGVEVELYNYPLCIVDHGLQPLYRKSITPSKIEYLPDCMGCARKQECGGFFRTTRVMPDITVRPY
jgi:His-Xaa-Ser system radical SAM maturase HxsC